MAATAAQFRDYLERCRSERRASHLIVTIGARELVGVVEILDIAHEPLATGRLGYYAFVPYAGRGLLREGVALAVVRAFVELGLERLTADVQKANRRSIAVLARLGFRREAGSNARKIGRRWLDHERWVLPREEWCALRQET